MKNNLIILITALWVMAAQAQPIQDPFRIATKETVQSNNVTATHSVRLAALREFALTKGLAEGRRMRFHEVHTYLQENKNVFDVIYQVDHLYMQPRRMHIETLKSGMQERRWRNDRAFTGFLIQPPIVLEGSNIMQIENNGQSKESTSVRYAIAANAMFVSAPLHWKTFLVAPEDLISRGPPDEPLLQPRDENELNIMRNFYNVGFNEGRTQATEEVNTRIKTLTTMIEGMTRGRILMDRGVLSEPEVTTQYIPVAGNNTLLNLNTSVARIVVPAGFELDPSKYRVIIHQANPFDRQ